MNFITFLFLFFLCNPLYSIDKSVIQGVVIKADRLDSIDMYYIGSVAPPVNTYLIQTDDSVQLWIEHAIYYRKDVDEVKIGDTYQFHGDTFSHDEYNTIPDSLLFKEQVNESDNGKRFIFTAKKAVYMKPDSIVK